MAAAERDVEQLRDAQGRFTKGARDAEVQSRRTGLAVRAMASAGRRVQSTYRAAIPASRAFGLALGVGVGGLAFAARHGWQELQTLNAVEQQTAARMKSTGGSANVSAKHIRARSIALEELSSIDENIIGAGQNMLLTFRNVRNEVGKGNKIFDRATMSAANLSAAGFGEMTMTSKMLGKVLNDPVAGISALSRAGVTFSQTQKDTIASMVESNNLLGAQKLVLAEIEKQVGGSAKAYGNSIEGMGNRVKDAFGDLSRAGVAFLLPIVERGIRPIVKWLGNLTDIVAKGGWSAAWDKVAPDWLKDNLGAIAGAIAGALVPAVIALGAAIWGAMTPLIPFIAIGALVGKLIVDHWDTIRSFVEERLMPAFQLVVSWMQDTLLPIARNVMQWFQNLWEDVGPVVMDTLGSIVSFADGVFDRLKNIIQFFVAIGIGLWERWGGFITGFLKGTWDTVVQVFKGAFRIIAGIFKIFSGILHGDWSMLWDGIVSVARGAWEIVLGVVKAAWGVLKFLFNIGWDIIKGVWDALWSGIAWVVKKYVSIVTAMWKGIINGVIAGINWIIDQINKIEIHVDVGPVHFDWNGVNLPNIPKLGWGGAVEPGHPYIVGDRGRSEVFVPTVPGNVVPIPQHEDVQLGDTGTDGRTRQPLIVQVMLDRRVVGEAVVDDIRDRDARS